MWQLTYSRVPSLDPRNSRIGGAFTYADKIEVRLESCLPSENSLKARSPSEWRPSIGRLFPAIDSSSEMKSKRGNEDIFMESASEFSVSTRNVTSALPYRSSTSVPGTSGSTTTIAKCSKSSTASTRRFSCDSQVCSLSPRMRVNRFCDSDDRLYVDPSTVLEGCLKAWRL